MKRKNIQAQSENCAISNMDEDAFETDFQNTDFGLSAVEGVSINLSAKRQKGRPKIGSRLNIVMPEDLISLLKKAAKKKGIGYQTMIRLICSEKIFEYI